MVKSLIGISDNLRFWFHFYGWIKITLKDGQSITLERSWANEEGWGSYAVTLRREGMRVYAEHVSDGSDCDGRLTRVSEKFFDAPDSDCLRAYEIDANGNHVDEDHNCPNWQDGENFQRDYRAEAAGY